MSNQEILMLIESGEYDKAIAALRDHHDMDSEDEVYYTAGRLCWKFGRQADAISFYRKAVAVNPDSQACHALEIAEDVLGFFNPDLLNP